MFPSVKFDRGHVRMEPGDIFVACTDGITEAMNAQDDEFGSQRLIDLVARERSLPAAEIVLNPVLTEVDHFSRGGTRENDRRLIMKVV